MGEGMHSCFTPGRTFRIRGVAYTVESSKQNFFYARAKLSPKIVAQGEVWSLGGWVLKAASVKAGNSEFIRVKFNFEPVEKP